LGFYPDQAVKEFGDRRAPDPHRGALNDDGGDGSAVVAPAAALLLSVLICPTREGGPADSSTTPLAMGITVGPLSPAGLA
jgi:hypothetical protein